MIIMKILTKIIWRFRLRNKKPDFIGHKCPQCRNETYSIRDNLFIHLIKNYCFNLRCSFVTIQTLHENDFRNL
ncbi:hypothetical protein LCGC14_0854910 [marine sediment metagenome]|uniref:Uncharacterized protein n=1 Tax=marine sediment metagenome TaxID=412755 RepID=A0A0F9P959_9ZZZZ